MLFFFQFTLKAQFTDSTTRFVKLTSGGSINKTKDGSNYLFNNNAYFNVRKKRTVLNSAATWIYGMNPEKLTNNDFTLSSNVNLYRHFTDFYYWGLVNYTTSYSLNIKSQGQAGIGIAYNFLNKPNVWLNVSNGMIGEASRIIQGIQLLLTTKPYEIRYGYSLCSNWETGLPSARGTSFSHRWSISAIILSPAIRNSLINFGKGSTLIPAFYITRSAELKKKT
ncbi:DUF481 domain-containing protein [Niabella sp. W65]|nr:DUF481 domain-containing protein [Niabella sp. W65]MCH7367986.1 DUF481 domain-containing protein [Niabella sp. W65]